MIAPASDVPALPDRLDDEAFFQLIGGQERYDVRLEIDYALCRLAWLNSGRWTDRSRPRLVLKGGFAIRHIYHSNRLSADVDVAPTHLLGRGQAGLALPSDFVLKSVDLARSEKAERWNMTFESVVGASEQRVWADVNFGRPVRLPPPEHKPFVSLFLPTFEVWVATIEEILAEKAQGLISYRYGDQDRIKDAFDLWFLMSNGRAQGLNRERLQVVLSTLWVTEGIKCPTSGFGVLFRSVLDERNAARDWGRHVRVQIVRGKTVSFDEVKQELPAMAQRHLG